MIIEHSKRKTRTLFLSYPQINRKKGVSFMEYCKCDGKVILPNAKDVKEIYNNKLRINIIEALQKAIDKGETSVEVKGYIPDWLISEMEKAGYRVIETGTPLTIAHKIIF